MSTTDVEHDQHRGAHQHDAHGVAEEVVNGISSLDEPSVGWGWHQHSRKVGLAVGTFFALFLLCMNFGNHVGNVENYILSAVAVGILLGMALLLRPRKDRTARKNRVMELPSGHYSAAN